MSDLCRLPELLAPAGDVAAFNAALAAGADAIYCGFGKDFNARRFAESFDEDEFTAACRRAHLAGTKVYVTFNILISTAEMPRVITQVLRAWQLGADAVIVQDWGLLWELRHILPELECHISTQANVHDVEGVLWSAKAGASRVTVSRELSLDEIADIAASGVDIECFCHGALCMCYSGVCLMSSLLGGRSANRGMCAQPCRLPYELTDVKGAVVNLSHIPGFGMKEGNRGLGGVRVLCPKDLCTVDILKEFVCRGVASLKIEGRMKAPEYVYTVVQAYREALDELRGKKNSANNIPYDRMRRLKRVFNRDFTASYLYGASGNDMMSYERSNNRGEEIGVVVASRELEDIMVRRGGSKGGRSRLRKMSRADVDIALTAPVGKGDLLEIRPLNDPSRFLCVSVQEVACIGDIITCRATRIMEQGSLVRVIRSQALVKAAGRFENKKVLRRRPISVRVRAFVGKPLEINLSVLDGAPEACVTGPILERARSKVLMSEDIIEHVGRMGDSPFIAVSWDISLGDGVGVSFSEIHKLRLKACHELEEAILLPYTSRHAPKLLENVSFLSSHSRLVLKFELCALVKDASSARAAQEAGASLVYARPEDLSLGRWPEGVIAWLDEICRYADKPLQDPYITSAHRVCVQNVSQFARAVKLGAIPEIGPGIPLHNTSALDFFAQRGARGFWASHELALDEICELAHYAKNLEVGYVVFGKEQLMITEHNVLMVMDDNDTDSLNKSSDISSLYALKNIDGLYLEHRLTAQGRSRIFAPRPHDAIPEIPHLMQAGVSRFLVDATLLDTSELQKQLMRAAHALNNKDTTGSIARYPGSSTGHLYAKIK